MKMPRLSLLCLFTALVASASAEEATIRQAAMLRADHTIVSLKPGTVVEIVSRDGDKVTVRYKNLTGTVPADKFDEPVAAAAKPADPKAKEPAPAAPAAPERPPQTMYGKAVQKARDNEKAHDKNLVKPSDEIMK